MSIRFVRGMAVAVAVIGVLVTIVAILFAVRAVSAWRETVRIQRGPRVLAVISATGKVSGQHQRVTLRYVDRGGAAHAIAVGYPLGRAADVIVGMSTSVRYDPRSPARAELAGHPRFGWQDIAVSAALVAVVTGIWLRWLRALLIAARTEEDAPTIRLGPPGSVERDPPARTANGPSRAHAYGTLAVLCALLVVGGRLTMQLALLDRPQEVAFPPLPVLAQNASHVQLPDVLTAPAPASGPLVTPAAARAIVNAAWRYRDDALARHDLASVRTIDADPALRVDVANQEAGTAPNRPAPADGDLRELTAYVPRQTRWPIRLLGEAVTTSQGEPVLEAMVLERTGPTASWRVALDTDVFGNASFTPAVGRPTVDADGYDVVPAPGWIDPSAVVPALAHYWQSLRETGKAPSDGVPFSPGYWTTKYGDSIANTQDTRDAHNDLRAHVVYGDRVTPADEVWTFGVDGWTLVCSPMHETKTWTGPAHQDANRQKWGGDLAPGVYRTITGEFVREPCLIVPPSPTPYGIVVFGADASSIATRGERSS